MVGSVWRDGGGGGAFLAILIYEVFSFMLLSGLFLALHGLGVFVFLCYFIDSKQESHSFIGIFFPFFFPPLTSIVLKSCLSECILGGA